MSPQRPGLGLVLGLLLAALLLAVAGEGLHRLRAMSERCQLDRLPIQPIYRSTVHLDDGRAWVFGSPTCALRTLQASPGVVASEVVLTDEVSGRPLPSSRAFLVRSKVETSVQDKNRIHVFADEIEARRHALVHSGELIDDPFAPWLKPAPAPAP